MHKRRLSKADKQIISTEPVSPFATRSGLQRNVKLVWSPTADLQDAINEADRNLTRMEEEANASIQNTTSNPSVTPHKDTPKTPVNTSVNTTPSTLSSIRVKRKQSPSPTVNIDNTGGATARSSREEEPEDPLIDIGPKNLNTELESDSSDSDSSLFQWKQNVQNAEGWSYKRTMDQEEYDWGPFTSGELEGILQESSMEKTNRLIK